MSPEYAAYAPSDADVKMIVLFAVAVYEYHAVWVDQLMGTDPSWDFGDGSPLGTSGEHRYSTDGDYTVTLTSTAPDGRTATTSQIVQVRTFDVEITMFEVPATARVGQTKTITVGVSNSRYNEDVTVTVSRSLPDAQFEAIGTLTKSVRARGTHQTTDFKIPYLFTADDAVATKTTFKAGISTNQRDAFPADNTIIDFPTRVKP